MRAINLGLPFTAVLFLCFMVPSCVAVPTDSFRAFIDGTLDQAPTAPAPATNANAAEDGVVSGWMAGMHKWIRSPWYGKGTGDICSDSDWRKASMKMVRELPIAGLFKDLKGTVKWEASGTDIVGDQVFMIFDSLDYVGYADTHFEYRAPQNKLIGRQSDTESSFEAIMFSPDTKTFLMVRETAPDDDGKTYAPSVVEATVGDDTYDILQECPVDFSFDAENKGFEGGAYFAVGGERYMLGLCEGNHCKGGDKGKDAGNGMAILTRLTTDKTTGKCVWAFVKKVPLPAEADFVDYSDIAVYKDPNAGDVLTVGVVSQENSALWIGTLDISKWEFGGPGSVVHFPRNSDCEPIYCNIEGISFIDRYQVITTSDRSKATQHYNCVARDQSVQIFLLPKPLKAADPPSTEL